MRIIESVASEGYETLGQSAEEADMAEPISGVRRRILLAEDDTEMRAMVAGALRDSGFEVIEAKDGAELTRALDEVALAMLERDEVRKLDLIISDIHMPGTTGMEVLARMRRAQMETPVILMTAFGDDRTHQEADRLGVEMVLDKPFALRDLLAAVSAVKPSRAA